MDASILEGLKATCRTILESGQGIFAWAWDTWPAGMVLSKIDKAGRKKAEALVREAFAGSWDHKTIASAPRIIQEIAGSYGGVKEGQLLYASNADADVVLVGLWWPWGNGENVSLRLGLEQGTVACDQNELDAAIRGWFGV